MRSSRDSQISRSRLRTLMVGVTTRVSEPRWAVLRLTPAAWAASGEPSATRTSVSDEEAGTSTATSIWSLPPRWPSSGR